MFPEISHEKILAWDGHDCYCMGRKFTKTPEMVNRNGSVQVVRRLTGITTRFDLGHILV